MKIKGTSGQFTITPSNAHVTSMEEALDYLFFECGIDLIDSGLEKLSDEEIIKRVNENINRNHNMKT